MTITDLQRQTQHGLTLLEMIVVLLVGGMAIALGFQSLGQWQRANTAMSKVGSSVQQTALIEAWFQDTVRGLTPIAGKPFAGKEQHIDGTTTEAVQMHQGGITHVSWAIDNLDGEAQLTVSEEGKSFHMRLPGATDAKFSFIDENGKAHDQWPTKLGLQVDLPAMVVLKITLESGRTQQWAEAIAGPLHPYYAPFELEEE